MAPVRHQPVLLAEVMEALRVRPGGTFLDGTLGGAGYTLGICLRLEGEGRVIALDRDPMAIARARARLADVAGTVRLHQANFADAAGVLGAEGIDRVDGAVLDLGLSSEQLAEEPRGFSFESRAPADMRMDPTEGPSATDLLNELPEKELARVIKDMGEEPRARELARRIVRARPLSSARELADLARGLYRGPSRVHPATRLFLALRMAVNDELGALDRALETLPERLAPGGRLVIVSFHSLEDRAVKRRFAELARARKDPVTGRPLERPEFALVTRKPIVPSEEERARNPRSRSAKLRALERRAA